MKSTSPAAALISILSLLASVLLPSARAQDIYETSQDVVYTSPSLTTSQSINTFISLPSGFSTFGPNQGVSLPIARNASPINGWYTRPYADDGCMEILILKQSGLIDLSATKVAGGVQMGGSITTSTYPSELVFRVTVRGRRLVTTGPADVTLAPYNGALPIQGTVSLTAPAIAGGAVVSLSSSAAGVPATVTVPAGATSAGFTMNPPDGHYPAEFFTITATYNNRSVQRLFTYNKLSVSVPTMAGGASVTGTVRSYYQGSNQVTLQSSDPSVTISPSTIYLVSPPPLPPGVFAIPEYNQPRATFTVSTSDPTPRQVVIYASQQYGVGRAAAIITAGSNEPPLGASSLSSAGLNGVAIGSASGSSGVRTDGTWVVNGTGSGFGSSDALWFEQKTIDGNFEAIAKIKRLAADASTAPRVGIMIREGLASNSRFVMAGTTLDRYVNTGSRAAVGASAVLSAPNSLYSYPNIWVGLARDGERISTYFSNDGNNWTAGEAVTMSGLAGTLNVGVFATAASANFTAQDVISNFTINQLVSPMVAAGSSSYFTLALKDDGSVAAWGHNGYGQLGDGTMVQRNSPVSMATADAVKLAAGGYHSLVLKRDGSVWACGYNHDGELGDGTQLNKTTPVKVLGLAGITDVSASVYHSVAVRNDGAVLAWGANTYGQLGTGNITTQLTPVTVLSNAKAVSAGMFYTLALKNDGTVWAWGQNSSGQLGIGTTTDSLSPVQVPGLSGIVAISAGSSHSLALRNDGTVWAWGANYGGQLGDGTATARLSPVQVQNLSGVTAIAAGGAHSLALTSAKEVWGWGYNSNGQVGDGTINARVTPYRVNGIASATSIAAGQAHSIVALADGTVKGWGFNKQGQLGASQGTGPALVSGALFVQKAYSGPSATHSLIQKNGGYLWGWGNNGFGQLGNNYAVSSPDQQQFGVLSNLSGITRASAGMNHTVAIVGGNVYASGYNASGQLGNGTTTDSVNPVRVSTIGACVSVAAAENHCLAVQSDTTVWGWGNNASGQLGNGTTSTKLTPYMIWNMTQAKEVATARTHSLILKKDGTVWAFGANDSGQLGTGDTVQQLRPVQVPGLSNVVAIACGESFSVALKGDGTVWTWGANWYGQIGDGTYTTRLSPTQVNISGVAGIAVGQYHVIAWKNTDYSVWAWGQNTSGQLGDGTSLNRTTPVQIPKIFGIQHAAAGAFHTILVNNDGSVTTFGYDGYGQLGTRAVVAPLAVPGLQLQ